MDVCAPPSNLKSQPFRKCRVPTQWLARETGIPSSDRRARSKHYESRSQRIAYKDVEKAPICAFGHLCSLGWDRGDAMQGWKVLKLLARRRSTKRLAALNLQLFSSAPPAAAASSLKRRKLQSRLITQQNANTMDILSHCHWRGRVGEAQE